MRPSDESLEDVGSTVVSGVHSAYNTPVAPPSHPHTYQPAQLLHFNKIALIIAGSMLSVMVVAAAAVFVISGVLSGKQSQNQNNEKTVTFPVSNVPLAVDPTEQLLNVSQATQLSINGQLKVGDTLVLNPTGAPVNPTKGQFYFDKTTNAVSYYDGTAFVSLAPKDSVSSLDGQTGEFALGDGLELNGQTLGLNTDILSSSGPRVRSLQGLSGDVTLLAGRGIVMDGTTISTSGVLSITGSNGLTVSTTNGAAVISLPQQLGVTATPTFSSVTLTNPLSPSSGGTGIAPSALMANGVLITDQAGTGYEVAQPSVGGTCLISDAADSNKIKFGSCSGSGSTGLGGSGTTNTIAMFTGAGSLGNSILTQSGTALTVGGTLAATSFSGNGSGLTNVNAAQLNGQSASFYVDAGNLTAGTLSDSRLSNNVALLNGATNNFTTSLQQGGNNVCTTANNCNYLTGSAANGSYIQLQSTTPGTAQTGHFNITGTGRAVALYQNGNQVCDTSGNCGGDGVGVTTIGALDSQTKSTNGAVISGSNLYLQTADATHAGLMSTGTQTFAGAKTFNGNLTVGTGNTVTLGSACSSGDVLTTNGSGQIVCAVDQVGGGDGVGVTTIGALDSQTKSTNGAVVVGSNLYLQTADATHAGLVGTGTQTFAGAKTFNGGVVTSTLQSGASTALTITANAASTWSTSTGALTLQSGSGTISFGTTTNLTSSGALTLAAGGTNQTLTLQGSGTGGITLNGQATATGILIAASGLHTGTSAGSDLRISSTGGLSNVFIPTNSTVTVGTANAFGILYSNSSNVLQFANINGSYGSTTKCLMSDGSTGLGFGTCPGGGGSSGWSLTGNSGTTAGTNFIGTSDNQAVIIKANSGAASPSSIQINSSSNDSIGAIIISGNGPAGSSGGGTNWFDVRQTGGNTFLGISGSGTTARVQMYLQPGSNIGASTRVCTTNAANTGGLGYMGACGSPADLAENYRSTQSLAPGELVMNDTVSHLNVLRAEHSSNNRLMGIVSTKPHEVMGQDEVPNGYPIALSGRVPTKVNGEGGPIQPGDKITTSSVAGIGKKATGPGMVVGTALSSFSGEGQGTIEVFVHLGYYDPEEISTLQGEDSSFEELQVSGMATIKDLTVTGSLSTHDISIGGHIITASGKPTVTPQVAAGANATISIDGNDTTGTLTINTGDAPIKGSLAEIVFSERYGKAPRVVLSPSNESAASLQYFKGDTTAEKFFFNTKEAPEPNSSYTFDYFISE